MSETDLYLLGAIEKLVYKMDLLDQRLKRSEELLQHVIEGPNIKRQGLSFRFFRSFPIRNFSKLNTYECTLQLRESFRYFEAL